jgi:hypothetical protein
MLTIETKGQTRTLPKKFKAVEKNFQEQYCPTPDIHTEQDLEQDLEQGLKQEDPTQKIARKILDYVRQTSQDPKKDFQDLISQPEIPDDVLQAITSDEIYIIDWDEIKAVLKEKTSDFERSSSKQVSFKENVEVIEYPVEKSFTKKKESSSHKKTTSRKKKRPKYIPYPEQSTKQKRTEKKQRTCQEIRDHFSGNYYRQAGAVLFVGSFAPVVYCALSGNAGFLLLWATLYAVGTLLMGVGSQGRRCSLYCGS